jgi:outer membrane protein assembly factor BamB
MIRQSVTALALLGVPAIALAGQVGVYNYHADSDHNGLYAMPGLTLTAAKTATLDTTFQGDFTGNVHAQPLYWRAEGASTGLILVATESNIVYALNATTGAIVWQRTVGTPVPLNTLPCGNIDPMGVTGTPVIDPATGTLYGDAMVTDSAGPQHILFALDVVTGAPRAGWPINVRTAVAKLGQTFAPLAQGERGALTFADGRLYVPFGGLAGDCGSYHGWVVGVHAASHSVFGAWSTRAAAGGIWAVGGISSDGASLFAATGNTEGAANWADGEALLRLPLTLAHETSTKDYFTPSDWKQLDNSDADIGGTSPVPINVPAKTGHATLLIGLGKDGKAYLADRDNLGGIGGNLVTATVSTGAIRTAIATVSTASATYVAAQYNATTQFCPHSQNGTGLTMLRVTDKTTPSLSCAWTTSLNGGGAPIITTTAAGADPIVWVTGAEGDNQLHGFNALTGTKIYPSGMVLYTMSNLHHFSTILAAEGRLYVAGDNKVYAFSFTY